MGAPHWVLLLLIGALACRRASHEEPPATAVPVTLAPVLRDSLGEEITITGRLTAVPGHDAVLTAPAAGMVRRVAAQLGSPVRPGRPLIELEVPELRAAARQQQATAVQAHREVLRQRRLIVDGVTSRRQLEDAEAAAAVADAAAAASTRLLVQTRIDSPITGLVQEIAVQPGVRVDAGARLARVIATDTVDLSAWVPATSLLRIHPGEPARLTPDGDSISYPGRVEAVAPAVDSLTNAGLILIRVPNREGRLRAGTGATARVAVGIRRNVLVVPDSALVLVGDSQAVFLVAADSIARQRTVTVGVSQNRRTEVRGALGVGDSVVVGGAAGLRDGMHVAPLRRP